MIVIRGDVSIEDAEEFLADIQRIADRYDCLIQVFDARYIVSEAHLQRSLSLAKRAHDRGNAIADDLAMEVLLYAAGTRQIDQAIQIGVKDDLEQIAILVDGENEQEGAGVILEQYIEADTDPAFDIARVSDWFKISNAERTATEATIEDLVLERVALLDIER